MASAQPETPNTSYFTSRFPLPQKIHQDRTLEDTMGYDELQALPLLCDRLGLPSWSLDLLLHGNNLLPWHPTRHSGKRLSLSQAVVTSITTF